MFIITAKFSRRRAFALAAVACLALALIVLPRACRKGAEAPAIPAETNEQRLAYLASLGLHVLRIPNNALTQNFPATCDYIDAVIKKRLKQK